MDNPELRSKMGQEGHDRVLNKLNWEVSARSLLTAYNKLFDKQTIQATAEDI
jgi:glycosyltransferase involved in cell wall biosynthesis